MIDAKVTGLEQLERAVAQAENRIARAMADAVELEARAVLADERELVPYDDGDLHDGIEVWFDVVDDNVTAFIGVRNSELMYAVFIEWGRSSAAAQPWATPASEIARKRWPARARKALAAAAKSKG